MSLLTPATAERMKAKQEHLIPLVGDIVKQVDRPHRRLVIDPPPGLLDP